MTDKAAGAASPRWLQFSRPVLEDPGHSQVTDGKQIGRVWLSKENKKRREPRDFFGLRNGIRGQLPKSPLEVAGRLRLRCGF